MTVLMRANHQYCGRVARPSKTAYCLMTSVYQCTATSFVPALSAAAERSVAARPQCKVASGP
jgi:hypothetical protein